MSGILTTVAVVGIAIFGFIHRDEIIAFVKQATATVTTGDGNTTTTPSKDSTATTSTGDKTAIADNTLGPGNFGDEGPDQGYGFAKSGGPVGPNGTAANGQPRAGDNSNNKNLTIADLPGPCESALYKGMIQYKHAGLSASADTCTHAKQYFLYKYGTGGTGGGTAAATTTTKAKTGKGKTTTTKKAKKGHLAVVSNFSRLSL